MKFQIPGALVAGLLCRACVPCLAEEPPPLPRTGGLVLFDEGWPPGVSFDAILGSKERVTVDSALSRFGSKSLRVACEERSRIELIIQVGDMVDRAPVSIQRGLLTASEKGALQFWLRADPPVGGLESWFKIFSPPKGQGERTELWNSKFVGTQAYVVPNGDFQEVVIPLNDFGTWNMDWFHMVRSLYFRFPTLLHGSVYNLDQIRILFEYPPERLEEQKARVRTGNLMRAAQDPYLWVFRDGEREVVEQSHLVRDPAKGWDASPPPQTPLNDYFARLRMDRADPGEKVDELYYDPEKWSFIIMDESQAMEGKRSLKANCDIKHGAVFTVPFLETDLTPIRNRGCLHLSVKGKHGGENFRVRLRSRRDYDHPMSGGDQIVRWIDRMTNAWQHVAIPLADFSDRAGGGGFRWEAVNGVFFDVPPTDEAESVFWVDAVWFGSCNKSGIPSL